MDTIVVDASVSVTAAGMWALCVVSSSVRGSALLWAQLPLTLWAISSKLFSSLT